MKKLFSSIFILLLVPSLLFANEKLINYTVKPFVHILNNKRIIGSGVITNTTEKETIILTSYHVIRKLECIEVEVPQWDSQGKYNTYTVTTANCVKCDVKNDFAFLMINIPNIEKDKVCITPSCYELGNLKLFDKIYAIGSSAGRKIWITEGIIANLQIKKSYIGISAPGYFGSSGGPIYNGSGKIIGMTSAVFSDYDHTVIPHMHLIIPLITIYNKLNKEEIMTFFKEPFKC